MLYILHTRVRPMYSNSARKDLKEIHETLSDFFCKTEIESDINILINYKTASRKALAFHFSPRARYIQMNVSS